MEVVCESVESSVKNISMPAVCLPDDGDVSKTSQNTFICSDCFEVFRSRRLLEHHRKLIHPGSSFFVEKLLKRHVAEYPFPCTSCKKTFKTTSELFSHTHKHHSSGRPGYKCPVCGTNMPKNTFVGHFQQKHNIAIETETLNFSSQSEYLSWKKKIEKDTASKFVKSRGSIVGKHFKHHYFHCNRSGYYVSEGQGIRHLKTSGSIKMGGNCPAGFEAFEASNGSYSVLFRKTHAGHVNDVCFLSLSSADRGLIAEKIKSNQSFDSILNEARRNISDSGLSRLNLLTKKDLYNIAIKAKKPNGGRLAEDEDICSQIYTDSRGMGLGNGVISHHEAVGYNLLESAEIIPHGNVSTFSVDDTPVVNSEICQVAHKKVQDVQNNRNEIKLLQNSMDESLKANISVNSGVLPCQFATDLIESASRRSLSCFKKGFDDQNFKRKEQLKSSFNTLITNIQNEVALSVVEGVMDKLKENIKCLSNDNEETLQNSVKIAENEQNCICRAGVSAQHNGMASS